MKISAKVSFLLAALLLASCSTMDAVDFLANAAKPKPGPGTPPPGQNPPPPGQSASSQNASGGSGAPHGLDAQAQAEWAKYSNPAPSGKSYAAGGDQTGLQAYTVKPGEWAVYRSLEGGKLKAVIKMAIVGKEGDAWIYEFVSYSEGDSAAIQEAVQGLDSVVQSGSADKGNVVWVKVKGRDGKVQRFDGALLGMGGAAYKNMLTANAATYAAGVTAGGIVTVPAGTFAATWKVQSQVSHGRSPGQGVGWVSTQVPLWHLIKAVSDDGNTVLELVDFGSSGYQSSFQ